MADERVESNRTQQLRCRGPGRAVVTGTSEFVALTVQEARVAAAVGAGLSNKAVARELGLSIKTVEFHLSNVYRKLGVASRVELANHVNGRPDPSLVRGNLPRQRSPLLARDAELGELEHVLAAASLVTLVGVGGVGKTSLAIAVGLRVADRFADGVWLVDLRTLTADRDLLNACFVSLALRPPATPLTARDLAVAVGHQQRLVIIDNCEHVIDDIARVADAIAALCPNVVVLATSRERFDIAGELVVPVRPLPLVDDGGGSASVRLFVARARQASGSFDPSPEELVVIDQICRRLDGLPLAIELASARVVGLSVAEILHRLDDRFRLLTRKRPSQRQHSLRATIEWSYGLLSVDERRVLESLAVFVGDFDLAAATAVAAEPGDHEPDVADRVALLVDKSMLVGVRSGGGVRYVMLETIREFGAERLTARGDRDVVRRRLLAHFARFIAGANVAVRGVDEVAGHAAIEREWHNLRTAIVVACDLDDGPSGCAILNDVLWWAFARERVEVGDWADRIRALPSLLGAPARVVATVCSAYFAWVRGQFDSAQQLIDLARHEEDELGEFPEPWPSRIGSMINRPQLRIKGGWADYPAALVPLADETLERAQRHGDQFWIAQGQLQQAGAVGYQTAYETDLDSITDRLEIMRDACALAQRLGHPDSIARADRMLGEALIRADPEQARLLLERSIMSSEQIGLHLSAGIARQNLVLVHLVQHRWEDAIQVTADAVTAHLRIGAVGEIPMDLAPVTHALARLGHTELAVRIGEAVRASHRTSFDGWQVQRALDRLATSAPKTAAPAPNEAPEVLTLARQLLNLAKTINDP